MRVLELTLVSLPSDFTLFLTCRFNPSGTVDMYFRCLKISRDWKNTELGFEFRTMILICLVDHLSQNGLLTERQKPGPILEFWNQSIYVDRGCPLQDIVMFWFILAAY